MKYKLAPFLSRNVIVLAVVSFFTDIATEMLYPIIPLYLSDIGYGIMLIAVIEGLAQLVTGAIKVLSGVYSDHVQQRKGLVLAGYSISTIAKPLMAVFPTYWAIFGFRLADRFGKGVRTAPRDALLADVSTPVTRGRVFGFHRAADTLGATLGPLITLLILYFYSDNIQLIIGLTAIPGVLAIVAGLFIKEQRKRRQLPTAEQGGVTALYARLRNYYRSATPQYKQVVRFVVVLSLLKSTDIFLLLRARELGLSDVMILSAYVAYNLAGAVLVFYLGSLSDRIGFAKTFAIGSMALGASYALLSQNELPLVGIFAAFVIYAIFQSVYEGLTSAWVSLHVTQKDRATGLGAMMAVQAAAALVGTIAIGVAWNFMGAKPVFACVGALAVGTGWWLASAKFRDYQSKTDHGRQPYTPHLNKLAVRNTNFRTVLWTGQQLQVTIMHIPVGDDIGLEAHKNIDQFLRVEEGKALVQMGKREDDLTFQQQVGVGDAILVPANTFHNIINTGKKPLKVSSIYAPAEHHFGAVHKTADDADREELAELIEDD